MIHHMKLVQYDQQRDNVFLLLDNDMQQLFTYTVITIYIVLSWYIHVQCMIQACTIHACMQEVGVVQCT